MIQYPQTSSSMSTANVESFSTIPVQSAMGAPYQREEYRRYDYRIPERDDRSYDSRDCYDGNHHESKRSRYDDESIG